MRFGAPLFGEWKNPEGWIKLLKQKGYNAAYCPVEVGASAAEIGEYKSAAKTNGIVIAEVGAWTHNPLHPDPAKAEEGYRGVVHALELAEEIGARCCVNVSGCRGEVWYSHHPLNLNQDTFEKIVAYISRLLDEVKPKRTAFTLEMMPWTIPTTPSESMDLIRAVGKPGFEAHIDLVNTVWSPKRYYENAQNTKECFRLFGGMVRSVHLKDVLLGPELTVHLDEVRAGLGGFDIGALLSSVRQYSPNATVMLEHLPDEREYDLAAAHVRSVAAGLGIQMPEAAK